MRRYQHTQIVWPTVGALVLGVVVTAAAVARASENLVPPLLLSAFLLTPLLFFSTLTVTVTDDEIILRSGVGLFRTRIPAGALRSCERIRRPWYHHSDDDPVPGPIFYSTSGSEAVDLSLADGTHLLIGTNEPDDLVDVLRRLVSMRAVQDPQARVSRANPILQALTFLFVPAFVLVALMAYVWTRPVSVSVSPGQISISGGIYRDEILVADIERVSLEPVLPTILQRTNAFRIGNSLRGHFLLQDLRETQHLFVEKDTPPYVKVVRTSQQVVWINFRNAERTRDLYATFVRTRAATR